MRAYGPLRYKTTKPSIPLRSGACSIGTEIRLMTFYRFPREHWKHVRTAKPVEAPFAVVRRRTGAAKRYKKAENATAEI